MATNILRAGVCGFACLSASALGIVLSPVEDGRQISLSQSDAMSMESYGQYDYSDLQFVQIAEEIQNLLA